MEDAMVPDHVSHLRDIETNILDAQTYLERINKLGLGAYSLIDGSKFPQYLQFAKCGTTDCQTEDLPEIEIQKGTKFCDILDKLLEQLRPYLDKGEADIFTQRVKMVE